LALLLKLTFGGYTQLLTRTGCYRGKQYLYYFRKLERIMTEDTSESNCVEIATELTIAWLSNSNTRTSPDDVPAFLNKMFETVSGIVGGTRAQLAPQAEDATEYTPAVTARKSLASPDHIISMIDGKPYKTLRRHLSTNGMTPEEYRQRYGLKADYPMVAPTYSEARRTMAKSIGLGRKPKVAAPVAKPAPTPRKPKLAAAAE
jgi:predicted transcriptional regulator